MQLNKVIYPPFIRVKDTTSKVMFDVVLALLPCILMSYCAFGFVPILLILASVGGAVATEFLFSLLFFNKKNSISDGSAIITGILLAFTIGAFTPPYVAAFGGAMGVLFGKLLWGGLGRNVFNPALIGREFMVVCFPVAMSSYTVWYNQFEVNIKDINLFANQFINELIFKPSGAVGEYSIVALLLGGLFLLLRNRISWHIPFALLATFTLLLFVFIGWDIHFSLGGLLLGAIFMATDMPSSASTNSGKLFYGATIGASAIAFILLGVNYEYMSYSILLVNAFVPLINRSFRPKTWGKSLALGSRLSQMAAAVGGIAIATFAIAYLHQLAGIQYLLYGYIIFIIMRFIIVNMRKHTVQN